MRRGRRKRLRKSQSQQDCANVADIGANAQPTVWPSVRQPVDAYMIRPTLWRSNGPSNRSTGRNNKPLLVGCKQSPVAGKHHPKAAKSWTNFIKKVVYCVDNVSSLTSADDLTNFVSGLDVKVTFCFKVKNRRPAWQRRNDSECRHKIFRLCVVKSDSAKLLQPRSWPADIVISPWFREKSKDHLEKDLPGNTIKFTTEQLHLVREMLDRFAQDTSHSIDDDNVHTAVMKYNHDGDGELHSVTSPRSVVSKALGIIRDSLSASASTSTKPEIGDVALAEAAANAERMDLHTDNITNNN